MQKSKILGLAAAVSVLVACGGSGGGSSTTAPVVTPLPPPAPVTLSGSIVDGPVTGGRLYVFGAANVNAALASADATLDRAAALARATPIASLVRREEDAAAYSINLPANFASTPVFVLFDSTGAVDQTFGDQPLDMETVLIAGASGSTTTANISPHTSMITTQVRALMNANGSSVSGDITAASARVIAALGKDEFGNEVVPEGTDLIHSKDQAFLVSSSTFLGGLVRATSVVSGVAGRDVLRALAADSADGVIDGVVPASLGTDKSVTDNARDTAHVANAGRIDFELDGGSCSVAANLLAKACEFDAMDDFLKGKGICQNTSDEETFAECLELVADDRDDIIEGCAVVHDARLDLCEDLDDAAHVPEFGEEFAANFVDPRQIGSTATPNPWFPLVQGNTWVYEGSFVEDADDGETPQTVVERITVMVTDRIKLIDGIPCVVVNDQVVKDGELIEDTDDWYAQDVEGNVWYCGEIAKNYETSDEDDPAEAEIVDIEGSWKHGRDTAEAGMLIPFSPEEGDIIRQEVLYGEAEDVVELLSLEGSASTPAVSCAGNCLVTRDFTPIGPGAEEEKYYAPGTGLILEVDPRSGDRVELISFTTE